MAGVNSKAQNQMSEIQMTCCLGDHPLHNPKLLPCQHSFCKECIETKVNEGKRGFTCPKCKLSLPLTENEIDQLQDDILYQIIQDSNDKHFCVICKFDDKKIPGTFQCLDCGDVLCDECKLGHTKTSLTRLHRLVSLQDIKGGRYKGDIVDVSKRLCHTHSKPNTAMVLEHYCEECKCLACQMCVLEEHKPKGHVYKTIDEVHGEKVIAVTDFVTKMLDLKKLDEEFATVLEQGQGHNKNLQEKLENEVHQRAALFMDIIERVKQDKLIEIKGHFTKENFVVQEELNETNNRMIRTNSIVSYTQAFLGHCDKAEFLQQENDILKKMKDYMQKKKNNTLNINVLEISEPQVEKTVALIAEAFGKITESTTTLGTYRKGKNAPRKWMKEPKVLFSVDSGIGSINGLTVTKNGDILGVARSSVQVYNSEGKPKERINCSQLHKAWNVVATSDKIYVSNRDVNGKVLEMDFKGNLNKTLLLPQTSHGDKGLAIDNEGNVYISSRGTNTIYKCEVNETKAKVFIPQGYHPDLNEPWYLCVTPYGEVVVSNYWSQTVQVYDRYGGFLWQYKGQGNMTLKKPCDVCCDSDSNIYISDCGNNRVQVIKNGAFQGCVQIKDFINQRGITLDKDCNIVCGFNNGSEFSKIKVWE